MTLGRKALWAVCILLLILFFAAISIPNLLRSRMAANEASRYGRLRSARAELEQEQSKLGLYAQVSPPEKKLILNAEIGLVVRDVRDAADQIQKLVESRHGELSKLEIWESGDNYKSATVLIRVPASGLSSALAELKRIAERTQREELSTRDVTREFYDNEAHLRNLRAEEQQYLAIMTQAHTVKDTLEVSQKIGDVRDRIERLQTQIQVMTHDIEMSEIAIALIQDSESRVFGISWRPWNNAKSAAHALLDGLSEWLDWVVAVLIKLPLFILWIGTVGGILFAAWKVGRSFWLRFKPKEGEPAE